MKKYCPYCKTTLIWDQFKEVWVCKTHGRFEYYPKESKDQCIKCFVCGDPAQACEDIPLQIGHLHFCSQECMCDYLVEEMRRMNEVDSF